MTAAISRVNELLKREATSAALKLLGESRWNRFTYFLGTYLIILVPMALTAWTGNLLIYIPGALAGFFAWRYWFNLVRSTMKHFSGQVANPLR